MDRYEENNVNEKNDDTHYLSRLEKNKQMYNGAYDSSKVVNFNDFLNDLQLSVSLWVYESVSLNFSTSH